MYVAILSRLWLLMVVAAVVSFLPSCAWDRANKGGVVAGAKVVGVRPDNVTTMPQTRTGTRNVGVLHENKPENDTASPEISKTFDTIDDGTLQLESMYASHEISSKPGDKVSIVVKRDVLDQYRNDAERILKEHKVKISPHSDGINIYTGTDQSVLERWQAAYLSIPPLRINIKITVPERYNIRAETSGRVSIREIGGKVTATSRLNALEVVDVEGSVDVEASGRVVVHNVSADVQATSRLNALEVVDVKGSVNAEASGRVSIREIGGKVTATSRLNALEVVDVEGSVDVEASGRVVIHNVSADVQATSRLNALKVSNVAGYVRARSSGDVTLVGIDERKVREAKSDMGKVRYQK